MSRRKLPCPQPPSSLLPALRAHAPVGLITALALAWTPSVFPQTSSAPRLQAPAAQMAQLPLTFEANRGQTDARVQFVARSSGAVVFLTAQGAVIKTPSRLAHMEFAGAQPQADLRGTQPAAAPVHYLRSHGSVAVPSFAQVRFNHLYPGVDLVYYGRQSSLEYDLNLAAHANPAQIRLRFSGVTPALAADGNLDLASGISLRHPRAYQTIAGVRQAVAVRYVVGRDHSVGFALGAYDHARPMVIDPVLVFATYLGGTSFNQANAVAVNASGNAYVTGTTLSADFPNPGSYSFGSYVADHDVFVAELAADGKSLVYSAYLGAAGDDEGNAIAVDAAGDAFVAGKTNSANFPTTAGALQTVAGGGYDGFVAKLNPAGSALVYSTLLGGSADDVMNGIAVDSAGDAVVAGFSYSSNYPVSGAVQATLQGQKSAVVTALNPAGSAIVYSTYLGGSGVTQANGVALDSSHNAYVVGSTSGTGFPVTPGVVQGTTDGKSYDGFIAKLSSFGNLVYASYLGGSQRDEINAIAVDSGGDAFITGDTSSALISTTFQGHLSGLTNAFVAEVTPDGSRLNYARYLGGQFTDIGTGIAVDLTGVAYVTGYTSSPDFPNVGGLQANIAGNDDAFLAKVSSDGNSLLFSTFLGGTSNDVANGLALDASGDLYIAGVTRSANFPVTAGVVQPTQSNSNDAFVAKFIAAAQGTFSPSTALGFPAQATGVASSSEAVVFANRGEKPLVISKIATTGPYTETDNCSANSSTLQPTSSCTINVVFTPTAAGSQNGTLVVTDNSPASPQSLPLEGSGGDFTIAVTPATGAVVTAGSSAAFSVELTPAAGYTGVVALTCTGSPLPPNSTCTASPTSLTMNGTSPSTASFTVTTTVRPALVPPVSGPTLPSGPWTWVLLTGLALGLLGTLAAALAKTLGGARRRLGWAGAALLLGWALVAAGCGGASSNPGTAAGNYTLTFVGTSGKVSHSTPATLTVN